MKVSRRTALFETSAGLTHIAADPQSLWSRELETADVLLRTAVDRGHTDLGWLQVARGALVVNGTRLLNGDAIATSRRTQPHVEATEPTDALLFDFA